MKIASAPQKVRVFLLRLAEDAQRVGPLYTLWPALRVGDLSP
jgi:hypothetical protein